QRAVDLHPFAGLLLRRPHSLSVAAGVAATARR
ncbi:hypothetical protein RBU13_25140, partial [Pseudomonas aeruginosa]